MSGSTPAKDAVARADLLEEAGDVDGAIAVLSEAIEELPEVPRLRALRGRLFKIRKRWGAAIRDFDAALALKPDAPTTLFFRGQCLAIIGEFDDALADFAACIRLEPSAADAYWETGVIHAFRGDRVRQIAAYRRAFELDPDRYPGLEEQLVELGREFEESKRTDDP